LSQLLQEEAMTVCSNYWCTHTVLQK